MPLVYLLAMRATETCVLPYTLDMNHICDARNCTNCVSFADIDDTIARRFYEISVE